jgi:hypothetical protein
MFYFSNLFFFFFSILIRIFLYLFLFTYNQNNCAFGLQVARVGAGNLAHKAPDLN